MILNTFAPIDPSLLDVTLAPSGYPEDVAAGDTLDALKFAAGDTVRSFPDELWIEPEDWADRARDNDTHHTWAHNFIDRYTNQDPTHECTCHSLTRGIEAAYNRSRGIIFPNGPTKNYRYPESAEFGSVWFAPLSVYAEANPREWGGAGVRQVLEIAVRRGILPDKMQPRDYGFKHTLHGTSGRGNNNQSAGDFVKVSQFPAGWQETAAKFKPLEVIFPDSYEQAVCLVLHGMAVHVGRRGHAVPWTFWKAVDGAMGYADSYDLTRYDSKQTVRSAWQGAFAIATMTTPDDWSKPAE